MAEKGVCRVHDLGRHSHGDALMEHALLWSILAALASGVLGAMGMGGGGVLVIYLTLALSTEQLEAQGINLLFFLPCAVISLIINHKRKLVDFKTAILIAATGLPATMLGIWIAGEMNTKWLGWVFAAFLIVVGLKELFSKSPANAQK
ncbi:MAG: sulfite exporter TauE/SafE family protein [Oscillospiraceae bacterium]|nr:sulfite exporter TauE/SafE family protein [Oscillospiraceae bacterium]